MIAGEFTGTVTGGTLPSATADRLAACLRSLDGRRVCVTVREMKRRRSLSQNAYYWGVVVAAVTQMFREAGNYVDADDTHDFLKLRVGKLSRVVVTPDGEVVKTLGSTAGLSTAEFSVYLERVRAWAAEFGVAIPPPDETTND